MKVLRWSTLCVYFFILIVDVIILSKAISPEIQKRFMRQFHLTTDSFGSWALLQFVPSMYNFANEVWISSQLIPASDTISSAGQARWFNHYPLRMLTFHLDRGLYWNNPSVQFIYLRSRYRDVELRSIYQIDRRENGINLKLLQDLRN